MVNDEIDILNLYAGKIKGFEDNMAWNRWLKDCLKHNKFNQLVSVRRGLQIGMASADKKKLVTESVGETYFRWVGSIDKTIRSIVKKQDLSGDYKAKKERDAELELFLRKESY